MVINVYPTFLSLIIIIIIQCYYYNVVVVVNFYPILLPQGHPRRLVTWKSHTLKSDDT